MKGRPFIIIIIMNKIISAVGLMFVALLIIGGWFWTSSETLLMSPEYASAATSSAVTVSASVTAVISCSTNQSSTAFGTLTDSTVATASPNASSTMSCANSSTGCVLYIKDAGNSTNGGLATSTPAYLIPSPNAAFAATSTLVAGTEGYGVNATTTATGTGATLTIAARYLQTGNTVGGLVVTNQTLGSTSATSSSREVVVTHKAAISASTPAGSYADTITYECTAN